MICEARRINARPKEYSLNSKHEHAKSGMVKLKFTSDAKEFKELRELTKTKIAEDKEWWKKNNPNKTMTQNQTTPGGSQNLMINNQTTNKPTHGIEPNHPNIITKEQPEPNHRGNPPEPVDQPPERYHQNPKTTQTQKTYKTY